MTVVRARVPEYLRADLLPDLGAGVSVAVLGVPQAMAFAVLAGVSPVYGLYAIEVAVIVASLFGSSPLMISGPSNAISVVLLSAVAGVPENRRIDQILVLTFLAGFFQCVLGAARLGRLLRYVSNSVVVGFTAGAGLLILAQQAPAFFGLEDVGSGRFFGLLYRTTDQVFANNLNPVAVFFGTGTIVLMVALARIEPRVPAALIAVFLSALAVRALGAETLQIDTVLGPGDRVDPMPTPRIPRFALEDIENLAGSALAIALLGLVQSASVARSLATRSYQQLDPSREFIAQGMMNMSASLFQGIAGCGSITRSWLNVASGARTRMAGVFSGFFALGLAFVLEPLFAHMPAATLAGIIILAAVSMFDWEHIRIAFRSTRGSTAVLVTTLVAALVLKLHVAVYVGVFLSLAIFLRLSSAVHMSRWVSAAHGDLRDQPLDDPVTPGRASVVNVEGDLFFGAVENLEEQLSNVAASAEHVVVLRVRRVRAMGSTAAEALLRFHEELRRKGVRLLLCGVGEELYEIFRKSGLRRVLGRENLFLASNLVLDSTRRALKQADEIIRKAERRKSPDEGHG